MTSASLITPRRFVEIDGVNFAFIAAWTLQTLPHIPFKTANQSIAHTPQ